MSSVTLRRNVFIAVTAVGSPSPGPVCHTDGRVANTRHRADHHTNPSHCKTPFLFFALPTHVSTTNEILSTHFAQDAIGLVVEKIAPKRKKGKLKRCPMATFV